MRLIDADALKTKLCRRKNSITDTYGKNDEWVFCLNEVLERIDNAPTIEAEPTKHGHWEVGYAPYGVVVHRCSLCSHTIATHEDSNYCPHCGAKMDEVDE